MSIRLRTGLREVARAVRSWQHRRFGAESQQVVAPHFKVTPPPLPGKVTKNTEEDYMLSHAVYSDQEMASVKVTHIPPATRGDRAALATISAIRRVFDSVTGYSHTTPMTLDAYILRIIFLETVAGVPGMVAAMARHLRSLRTLSRDYGWIHTLLEEAENERMHLLTFCELRECGWGIRGAIMLGQGVAWNLYFTAYLLFPRACHRFVGYLEEEAVKTYTHIVNDIDGAGHASVKEWGAKPAPPIAIKYWRMKPTATMRDLVLAVRADEAIHRDVNHTLSTLPDGVKNPFA